MASIDAFRELWTAFANESLAGFRPLGVEDVEGFQFAAFDESLGPYLRENLQRREQLVTRLLLQFADDQDRPIVETLPVWCGCLSTPALQAHSREPHARTFLEAIAEVLHSRVIRRAIWWRRRDLRQDEVSTMAMRDWPPGRPAREPLELEFRKVQEECGDVVQQMLEVRQRTYRSLLEGGDHGNQTSPSAVALRRTVIVHGTWAASADWWRDPVSAPPKPDNLWTFLSNNGAVGLVGSPDEFVWSGGNSDADRRQGALDFLNWWRGLQEPQLDVVSHSHGGNVVMLALAAEPALDLRRLVLLGTPSRFDYVPRAKQTAELYNVYSTHDSVQVLGSMGAQRGEGRTQSDHPAATNRHAPYWDPNVYGVRAVGHSDLHHPDVWANHHLMQLLA